MLPAVVGRNKKANLNYIKKRVWNKSQGWKEKLLSQVGRKFLLKAMVQAIPTFTMSCFKLPLGLCHDIEIIRNFGRDNWESKEKFTRRVGSHCVNQKTKVGWGLKTW